MQVKDEEIQQTVATLIAAEIVKQMTPERRDAVLAKAMGEALGSYSLKNAVEHAVAEKAAGIAVKMVDSDKWQQIIEDKVREGLFLYMAELPLAVAKTLREALHGKKDERGYGSGPGLILKRIVFPGEEK